MSKYDGITRLLADRSEPVITIPWDVLDGAVGGLPASASNHQPWWHGDRAQVHAWRAADYVLDRVEPGRAVIFRRSTVGAAAPSDRPRHTTPTPPARIPAGEPQLAALAALAPIGTLVVIPCSKRKATGGRSSAGEDGHGPAIWSSALHDARERIASAADRDEGLLLPAWQRYTGTFYTHAAQALTDAAGRHADLLILSGGYGVLELTEPAGRYERLLHTGDWPPGLLGREIAGYAHRRGLRDLVAFVAGRSAYAQVIRSTDWARLGLEQVILVSPDSAGGAQLSVPRDLGLGFAAWYRGQLDAAPGSLWVEPILTTSSPRPLPTTAEGPTPAGPTRPAAVAAAEAAAQRAIRHLGDHANACPAHLIDPHDPILRHPGLYAWWADDEALHLLRHSLGEDIGRLIYAGQAGATTRRRAISRAATLKSRVIDQHLRTQTGGSTFALTLAAALRKPLGLTFHCPRKIDVSSRHALALWMRAHLAVATYPVPDPTHLARLEDDVLQALDPSLNLDGRPTTPVRTRLAALRRAAGGTE